MKFDIHKTGKTILYENSEGKKIVGHSKLKIWTFIKRNYVVGLEIVLSITKTKTYFSKTFWMLVN